MSTSERVGIGIIGCGNISGAYLKAMQGFAVLEVRGIADMNPAAAEARAAEFGVTARPPGDLLAADDIEIIVNLTVPRAHVSVGLEALAAGKHVYSEKPLGIAFADGQRLLAAAEKAGLRVGSAPDTFLGGAHQTCRRLVDEGVLGTPVGGTAFFMCPGHERWHPSPAFYYEAGGGPMLDMGPYYVTDLVNLLGPVARVTGMASMLRRERLITSQPLNGTHIPVEVPTHVTGMLEFANGAVVQIGMSFDVAAHKHVPLEIYGTEGTLAVPDPNYFGGDIQYLKKGGEWQGVATVMPYADGNYRSLGVADMALALRQNRPHRASGALALHVLEVMEAIGTSASTGRHVEITTRVERPAPLAESIRDGKLA